MAGDRGLPDGTAPCQRATGALAQLDVLRDGAIRQLPIKLTERPLVQPTRASKVRSDLRPADERRGGPLGLLVQNVDAAAIQRLGVPASITGVLITDLDATGVAREARLRRGQILMEVNRRAVTTVVEFTAATASLKPGDAVVVMVYDPIIDQRVMVTMVLETEG